MTGVDLNKIAEAFLNRAKKDKVKIIFLKTTYKY